MSWIVPVLGIVFSAIGLKKVKNDSLRGKGLAIAGIVIGSILTIIGFAALFFMLFLFFLLGGSHGNDAETESQLITKRIEAIGAKKICDNGDSGYGIDNTVPWYTIYYKVNNAESLTNTVKEIANQSGYSLESNTKFINQLKGLPDEDGGHTQPYGDEKFSSDSDYLTGRNGKKTLDINIYRKTNVSLYCNFDNVDDYGKQISTGDENAIIMMDFGLPEVNR